MKQTHLHLVLASLLILIVGADCLDRLANGRRVSNNAGSSFESPCGGIDQVAHRLGGCLEPVFDLVEGKFEEPKGDADYIIHCGRFNTTEKCVRLVAKDCLSGLPKTTTSAVASAIRRFRTSECKDAASRGKYKNAYTCARKRGPDMAVAYKNHTAIGQAIRDLPGVAIEDKMIKICCLISQLDKEIERQYSRACPSETQLLLGIVHAMTDDARNTLCRNPKCDGALNGVLQARYKPGQNFFEPIMQVLFTLGS